MQKAVSIATNSLVSITPTRRVGVNIGQKSAIGTNSHMKKFCGEMVARRVGGNSAFLVDIDTNAASWCQ